MIERGALVYRAGNGGCGSRADREWAAFETAAIQREQMEMIAQARAA